MKNRPKILLVNPVLALLLVIVYGGIWAFAHVLRHYQLPEEAIAQLTGKHAQILLWASLLMGLNRGARFHPAMNTGYARWLATTPWHYPMPLPMGPVFLAWQDALLVLALAALAQFHAHVDPLMVLSCFLGGYVAGGMLVITLAIKWEWLLLVLLGPALVFVRANPAALALGIIVLTLLVTLGLRRSLIGYSWPLESARKDRTHKDTDIGIGTNANAGWPFSYVGPSVSLQVIPWSEMLLAAVIAGWWMFCGTSMLDLPASRETYEALGNAPWLVVPAVAVLRLLLYIHCQFPPISLLGRLATGRWIIPRYDQVLVGPAATVLVGMAVWHLAASVLAPLPLAAGIGVAAVLTCALGIGPSLRNFRLTAPCRFVTGTNSSGGNKQRATQQRQ